MVARGTQGEGFGSEQLITWKSLAASPFCTEAPCVVLPDGRIKCLSSPRTVFPAVWLPDKLSCSPFCDTLATSRLQTLMTFNSGALE